MLRLLMKMAFWTGTVGAQLRNCPPEFEDPCFNEHLLAAVDLAVKLALANEGQFHLTIPLENKFFVMGTKQAELFIGSRLPPLLLSRVLLRVPSIKQEPLWNLSKIRKVPTGDENSSVKRLLADRCSFMAAVNVTLDDERMMLWDSQNSNHTIKLKIYTVNGETKKVHVLVEDREYQLPENQKSFNKLLIKYPGLVYSLFKTFSEHSIPFVFDEVSGELRVLINGTSAKPYSVQTVTLSIDGKNYSLPAQWGDIQNDTEHGLITRPAQLVQLLNESNVTIPLSVLNIVKRRIKLVFQFNGREYELPKDVSLVSQVLRGRGGSTEAVRELRDALLISGALNSVEGSQLRIHHPYNLQPNLSAIPLPEKFNYDSKALLEVFVDNNKLHVRGRRASFVFPGDEEKLKKVLKDELSPSVLVDAIRRAGFQVTASLSNRLLINGGGKEFLCFLLPRIVLPTVLRRHHKLQLRIKGRPGRLTYFLTLPDGRQLALPAQWNLLQSLVQQGQIRFEKLLELLGRKSAKITVAKNSENSFAFRINDQDLQLEKSSITSKTQTR